MRMRTPPCILRAGLIAAFIVVTAPAAADEIIAAKKGKVYHTHRCGATRNIDPDNVIHYKSAEEAEEEGRRRCKMCVKLAEREEKKEKSRADDKKPPAPKGKASNEAGNQPPAVPASLSGASAKEPRDTPLDAGASSRTIQTRVERVQQVLPGGTLVLESGERACFLGIGCPRTGQCMAQESVDHLTRRLKGKKVKLRCVVPNDDEIIRDKLGRIEATVCTGSDDEDVAVALLTEGLAWVDEQSHCDRIEEYRSRQEDAAWAQRGVWKRLEGAAGRREVVVGKHTQQYHAANCIHVPHLIQPSRVTLNEARGRVLAPCPIWQDDESPRANQSARDDQRLERAAPGGNAPTFPSSRDPA